jgi:hypothetical protein
MRRNTESLVNIDHMPNEIYASLANWNTPGLKLRQLPFDPQGTTFDGRSPLLLGIWRPFREASSTQVRLSPAIRSDAPTGGAFRLGIGRLMSKGIVMQPTILGPPPSWAQNTLQCRICRFDACANW